MDKKISVTLKVWRQKCGALDGHFEIHEAKNISTNMSFLEMLDVVNEGLIEQGKDPIAFDHDCREGICGMCGLVINGLAHGPDSGATVCQLHMRRFKDGDTIAIEPWRAKAFPVVKDLVVDRSAFDRVMQAGGYNSTHTGAAPEANSILISKEAVEEAMDAAACIGCGACVAACPNASAMLFVASKISHLSRLPQGQVERQKRVLEMLKAHDAEKFGNCTNEAECEAACPKEIKLSHIGRLNQEFVKALIKG